MKKIMIKPHHFMDIIKLYGSGIEVFVPDQKLGHDFYRIANEIIQHPDRILELTAEGDDICQPCRLYDQICTDPLTKIPGYTTKEEYNRVLDQRILSLYHLGDVYSARDLCQILLSSHSLIDQVWLEEDDKVTERRHSLFVAGAQKYLAL